MLATLPGQTIFVAQFGDQLREQFSLTHGDFGGIFMLATLASAALLPVLGGLVDRVEPRLFAVLCVLGLAATSLGMAINSNVIVFALLLFALRFLGQGMLGHVVSTTMSRWFSAFRGRALSIASLGNPTGSAVLPLVITLSIAAVGWRATWVITAAVLIVPFGVAIWLLLNGKAGRAEAAGAVAPATSVATTGSEWTRRRVLRDPIFYVILIGVVLAPAVGTLYIFHQLHLIDLKQWDPTYFAAVFPLLPAATVVMSLVSGSLVDRFGGWRVLPFTLLPNVVGCLVVATFAAPWSVPLFLVSIGMSNGMMWPVLGGLWAEMYGTTHLGAVRSVVASVVVAATAVGPGIAGFMIDAGVELDAQGYGYALFGLAATAGYVAIRRPLGRRVRQIAGERPASVPGAAG